MMRRCFGILCLAIAALVAGCQTSGDYVAKAGEERVLYRGDILELYNLVSEHRTVLFDGVAYTVDGTACSVKLRQKDHTGIYGLPKGSVIVDLGGNDVILGPPGQPTAP